MGREAKAVSSLTSRSVNPKIPSSDFVAAISLGLSQSILSKSRNIVWCPSTPQTNQSREGQTVSCERDLTKSTLHLSKIHPI